MPDPQIQTSTAEIADPARERDPHAQPDAAEMIGFDEEVAKAEMQEGKKSFEQLFTEQTEIVPNYDREPGLQTKELDQYAIGLGFLISERIKQNPKLTYEEFLQSLRQNKSPTSQFTQEITGANAKTEMGIYLNEYLPAYFDFVKGLIAEVEKNKDDPSALQRSMTWLSDEWKDVAEHPEGMPQGVVEKGAEWGKNIFEFVKKNKKEVAITAALIGGVYLLKNFFFGKKSNAPSQAQESGGFWGFIKKTLKIGGIGALGAGLIVAIWKGPEAIKKWVTDNLSKLKEEVQKKIEEKVKKPMVEILSIFMGEEEAKKTVDGWFDDKGDEETDKSENKDGKEEPREPNVLAEAAEKYSPEWLKKWWDETMKPKILTWLKENKVNEKLAKEALEHFDIVKLAEEYIKAGGSIIEKASRTVFVASTGLMTAGFALFALKKTIPFLVSNTFRIGKFAALKLFRHPIIAVLGGLGVALGASSTNAQEVAEKELKKIFGDFERELLPEEKKFFDVVSEKTGIPVDYLEKIGGMRLKDFLSMGDNILKQVGEASGIFDYQEEWHTHFATLYDFLMEENRRDELDGLFFGEIDRKMTVAGALAILLGDSEIKEKSKRADEDQENIGMIEAGWEQAEFSVLHKGIADFVDALPEDVQEKIYEWDKENPNLRGTISRATKVFDVIAGNFDEAWFSAGTVILKKGVGIFVYPLALAEDLAKNIIGGEWEEVALDAAEGFAAMTTVKILTLNKIGYKTQLKPIAKIIASITQGSRILPRIGIQIDTARLSLLNTRNEWSLLVTEKSQQAEHRIMQKKLDFYIDEYDWWDKKRIKKPNKEFMDGLKAKIRDLFLDIQDFEVDKKIPKEMCLKEKNYNEYREARRSARSRQARRAPTGTTERTTAPPEASPRPAPTSGTNPPTSANPASGNPTASPTPDRSPKDRVVVPESELAERRAKRLAAAPKPAATPLPTDGNTALKPEPQPRPTPTKPEAAPVESLTPEQTQRIDAEASKIAERQGKSLEAVKKSARGLLKAGGYALTIVFLEQIARSDDPIKTTAEIAVYGSIIGGTAAVGGPIAGVAIGLLTIVFGSEAVNAGIEKAEATMNEWADKQGKSHEMYAVQRGVGEVLKGILQEPFWDSTIGEFWKGEDAFAYFSDTTAQTKSFTEVETVLHRGSEDIEKWNEHIQEKITDEEESLQSMKRRLSLLEQKDSSQLQGRNRAAHSMQKSSLEKRIPETEEDIAYLKTQLITAESGWLDIQRQNTIKEYGVIKDAFDTSVATLHARDDFFRRIQTYKNMGVWEKLWEDRDDLEEEKRAIERFHEIYSKEGIEQQAPKETKEAT